MKHPSSKPLAYAISKAISGPHTRTAGRQDGLGLFGVILTLALSTVVAGVGFTVYSHADHARQISLETVNAQGLKQSIQASYASSPNFSSLTNTSALHENIFPKSSLDRMGNPKNTWGGAILVAAVNVAGHAGGGFAITYENVPTSTCARFAAQGAAGFYNTKINQQSIIDNKVVQTATAINLCSNSNRNTVQFIQVKQSPDGPTNPTLTACVIQPDQARQSACPAGQISSVSPYGPNGLSQSRHSFCNSVYGTLGWTPWKTVASTCAPVCVPGAPTPTSRALTGSCPAGYAVSGTTSTTFPQTQIGTVNYHCPAPTGPDSPDAPVWGSISPSAATMCAPICAAPAPTPRSGSQTTGCPAGRVTPAGASSFNQTRTGSTSYTCPSPTGPFTTNATSWNAWTPTAATACAPKCVAPGPSVTYAPSLSKVTHPACPAGYSGSITITQPRRTTTTTTYSCAAPTGNATPRSTSSTGNYGAATTRNTCAKPPPPPAPTTKYKWIRDDYAAPFNYEPSVSRDSEDIYYGGNSASGAGCYTCYDNGQHQCNFSQQINSCSCNAANDGANFSDRRSIAGTGTGEDISLCVDCSDPYYNANYRDCRSSPPAPPSVIVTYRWVGDSQSDGQDRCYGNERVNTGIQDGERLAETEAGSNVGACSAARLNQYYYDDFFFCDGPAGDTGRIFGATCTKSCTRNGRYVPCP